MLGKRCNGNRYNGGEFLFCSVLIYIPIVYVKLGDAIDSQNVCIVLEGSNSNRTNSSKQQQLQRQHQ
jgi:hypothetical protein